LQSNSSVVRDVARYVTFTCRCSSVLGSNALHCCSYFALQSDKFVSGDVDPCNSSLLRSFHGRVGVSDWYAVQSLADAFNVHVLCSSLMLLASSPHPICVLSSSVY